MARWGFWDWMAYLCLGIAALGLAAGAALKEEPTMLERLPSFFTSPKWAYVPIILFACGSAILAVRFVAPLLVGAPLPITERSGERVFVEETPQYLMALGENHTIVQRDKLTEVYIDKWLKISGPVENVYRHGRGARILMKFDGLQGVWFQFDAKWTDRIIIMSRGQKITAIGQIKNIGRFDLELENCELTETVPPAQ